METICIKTKIKPGHIDEMRLWFKNLHSRQPEVLETLKNEGVVVESAFLDKQGDDLFLIYYMKAESVEKAYDVFTKSTSSIDIYFKNEWKQHCEGRIVLEELLDLDVL